MLSRLINYFEQEDYRGIPFCILTMATTILLVMFGIHSAEMAHLQYVYYYLAIIPVLFLASSRCKFEDDGHRIVAILASFLWLPTITCLSIFFVIRQLLFVPGYLVAIHGWLSDAKLPSFRKDIEMGEVPNQGPFRDSACCNSCNRPL